jgi:glycosyltransferase involved in cell wall biosynthesis
MKIALISYFFGEYTILTASALAEYAEVLLIVPSDEVALYGSALTSKVKLMTFDRPRLRQPLRQLLTIRRIVAKIHAFKPDVIHLQQGHLYFNFALPLLRRYPLVITVHDPQHHVGDKESRKTPQFVMNAGYRQATRLIVHAERMKDALAGEGQVPRDKIDIVPHLAIGDPDAAQDVSEVPNTVLFFGRIWAYKGLDYLIKAEPLISDVIPDVRIVIAGRGDDFGPYRELMIHPDRFVVYNDFITDEHKHQLFREASVVVLPYIEATVSGVIPTAYTLAKPVVATTVGGLPEMVDDGKTGYLVPPRDAEGIAEAVIKLLRDPEARRMMGDQAKHKIESEWSPDACARKTLKVYEAALG